MEVHFLVNLFGRPWAATCTLGPRVPHSCNVGSASKRGMRDGEFHKQTLEIQEMKNKLKVCSSKCACKDHPWKHKTLVQGPPGRRGRSSPSTVTPFKVRPMDCYYIRTGSIWKQLVPSVSSQNAECVFIHTDNITHLYGMVWFFCVERFSNGLTS